MTDKLNYVMGEYLKFYGIVRFEKFRLQTHIVLFLPARIAGEAEGEKDLIIPGDLRAVQREPFRYPFLSAAVLMAQPALLDVVGPDAFYPDRYSHRTHPPRSNSR